MSASKFGTKEIRVWVLTHRELGMDYDLEMHEIALAESERAIQTMYNKTAEERAERLALEAEYPLEGWDMDCYE